LKIHRQVPRERVSLFFWKITRLALPVKLSLGCAFSKLGNNIRCVGGSRMKKDPITVRLDDDLVPILDEFCRRSGRTRSEVMREALKHHLAQLRFEQLRRRVMPFAKARSYLTDEDVFDRVS
jgi:predicted transcriptional regulator